MKLQQINLQENFTNNNDNAIETPAFAKKFKISPPNNFLFGSKIALNFFMVDKDMY